MATPSTQRPPSRPTTPLRPPSRTSLRASQTTPGSSSKPYASFSTSEHDDPLLALEPAFAELSDSMADLEANMMHLQLLNESISRFNENFAAFLYGMNMTAFCVDFPEAPISQSFTRSHEPSAPDYDTAAFRNASSTTKTAGAASGAEPEATFLTTDTSFVENPPPTTSSKGHKYSHSVPTTTPKRRGMASSGRGHADLGRMGQMQQAVHGGRGGASSSSSSARGGRGAGGGIPRASSRGGRGSTSGIARGIPRGISR